MWLREYRSLNSNNPISLINIHINLGRQTSEKVASHTAHKVLQVRVPVYQSNSFHQIILLLNRQILLSTHSPSFSNVKLKSAKEVMGPHETWRSWPSWIDFKILFHPNAKIFDSDFFRFKLSVVSVDYAMTSHALINNTWLIDTE